MDTPGVVAVQDTLAPSKESKMCSIVLVLALVASPAVARKAEVNWNVLGIQIT